MWRFSLSSTTILPFEAGDLPDRRSSVSMFRGV
jgi:hypothetical protein